MVSAATAALAKAREGLPGGGTVELKFDHVTAKPLSRDTLADASDYHDQGPASGWTLVTAMPESFYLSGLRAGHGAQRNRICTGPRDLADSCCDARIDGHRAAATHLDRNRSDGWGDMETRVSGGTLTSCSRPGGLVQ